MVQTRWIVGLWAIGGLACTVDPSGGATLSGGADNTTVGPVDPSSDSGDSTGDDDGGATDGAVYDVGAGPGSSECRPIDNLDAPGDCTEQAPPGSFEPTVQWTLTDDPDTQLPLESAVIPLVGNFTDDNADGEIDLCDTPDVILVAGAPFIGYGLTCDAFLLDGATGALHRKIGAHGLSCLSTPAFADIDGDQEPELVALVMEQPGVYRLRAFEPDGTVHAIATQGGEGEDPFFRQSAAIAIHDLDGDGDAEILLGHEVYDHTLTRLWTQPNPLPLEGEATTAADLDGDGDLEVITGHAVYDHTGAVVFDLYPTVSGRAFPQVGDLDDDGLPELLLTTEDGIFVVEHDGGIKFGPVRPTGVEPVDFNTWTRPATIHDFDGDGRAEWAGSSESFYAVYEGPSASDLLWTATISDVTGSAAGTAFDFLGDGVAEAMYGDEWTLTVYDGQTGTAELTQPRCSGTATEYPVVADVDNDGSAEILVVSSSCVDGTRAEAALQVLGEAEDRWIQARRIWNQHTYHVTNVREDSTLPMPVDNWATLNTFRTNAQIAADGGVCMPPVG